MAEQIPVTVPVAGAGMEVGPRGSFPGDYTEIAAVVELRH